MLRDVHAIMDVIVVEIDYEAPTLLGSFTI